MHLFSFERVKEGLGELRNYGIPAPDVQKSFFFPRVVMETREMIPQEEKIVVKQIEPVENN